MFVSENFPKGSCRIPFDVDVFEELGPFEVIRFHDSMIILFDLLEQVSKLFQLKDKNMLFTLMSAFSMKEKYLFFFLSEVSKTRVTQFGALEIYIKNSSFVIKLLTFIQSNLDTSF